MAKSVLVVESDPFIRQVLQRRLRNDGYEVRGAANGIEGLEAVEGLSPDMVISDWEMPRMDGMEFCRRVKEQPNCRSVYFILLTSRDQEQDIVEALQAGADEYLVKPVDVKELLARVQAGMRIAGLQHDLEQANESLNHALKRIDRELQVVAGIQRMLLPQSLPTVSGLEFGVFYLPSSECGGDYYDVLPLGDERFGVVLADVSGHGTPAMVAMALTRLLVHHHAEASESPADLLGTLNRELFEHLPTEQYVTMFYGILDARRRRLTYSSAGQTPPVWTSARRETVETLPNCEGFPLKLVQPDVIYQNSDLQMDGGDQLALYTDGLTETINDAMDLYGIDRLKASLRLRRDAAPHERAGLIAADAQDFAAGAPQNDDISLLLIDLLNGSKTARIADCRVPIAD
ncbi:MAG: SpoIIE family protein phosphatase [Candidatus Sumerlaeota bacterium]|nr:SpoIIE family protein phosphatase [Candidatus Sumerlaeota bacterium]